MRRLLVLALVLLLVSSGCVGALRGLVVVVSNSSEEPVAGTLTLSRPEGNATIATRTFQLAPGELVKIDGLTRDVGLFVLNVTLDDGRSVQATVRGGGAMQDPQVEVRPDGIVVEQKESKTGRGMS